MFSKDLELKKKNEVRTPEKTYACRTFEPDVDIYETKDEIVLLADMPGVHKKDVNIHLKDDILTIEGTVRPEEYEGLRPIYSEYNIGNYHRSFSLSEAIDQNKIDASLEDGVLKIVLHKIEKAKPKSISIR